MLTRRELLSTAGGAALAAVAGPRLHAAAPLTAFAPPQAATGPFTLPPLPYPVAALEPHIDAQTMTIHHDRHHQGYVNGLNAALAKEPSVAGRSLDDMLSNLGAVPEGIRTAVQNSGGGHYNHTQFWTLMSPSGGGSPHGRRRRGDYGSLWRLRHVQATVRPSRRVTIRERLGVVER